MTPERAVRARGVVIAACAFFTLVDLFAAQAVLPELAARYRTSPAMAGAAVNASTLGMAVAGLLVALFGRGVDRRRGIALALALLALPTAALGHAPDLAVFTALRVAQGLCMATAFGLTLAHLGERCSADEAAGAFAAYAAGNVASNLAGRLIAALAVGGAGLAAGFHLFAALNLVGAVLVWWSVTRAPPMSSPGGVAPSAAAAIRAHLANAPLRALFAIGFCLLFAFVGVFSYVSFVLARPPYSLGMMRSGLVYLVFAPSLVTTSLAGRLVRRIGPVRALRAALGAASAGLPLTLMGALAPMLGGLALVAAGLFLAQAVATGAVGAAAEGERGAASGLYLAAYFAGGLAGSAAVGLAFEAGRWPGSVAVCAAALAIPLALAGSARPRKRT